MNSNRIVASLEQKLSQDVGYRVDLHVCDARRVNNITAHFMVGYDGLTPTSAELQDFFVRHFDAKILPSVATARVYKDQQVVTLVASMLTQTREMSDIARRGMVPVVAGLSYLDAALEEVWEVKENNGEHRLFRKERDNIMQLVEARRAKMMEGSKKSFASVATASNIIKYLSMLEKGDVVKVYCDGKLCDAEILAADEGKVKVKYMGSGKTEELPRTNVIEVLEKNADKINKEKLATEKYFADAYGDPSYAKQLVK